MKDKSIKAEYVNEKLNETIQKIKSENIKKCNGFTIKLIGIAMFILVTLAFVRFKISMTTLIGCSWLVIMSILITIVNRKVKDEMLKAALLISLCELTANVYSVLVGGSSTVYILNYVLIALSAMYFNNTILMYCAIPMIVQVLVLVFVFPNAIGGPGTDTWVAFDALIFLSGAIILVRKINIMGASINMRSYEGLATIQESSSKYSHIATELNDVVKESSDIVEDLVEQSNYIEVASTEVSTDAVTITESVSKVNESVEVVREYIDIDKSIASDLHEKYDAVTDGVKTGMDRVVRTKDTMQKMEQSIIDAYKVTRELVVSMEEIDVILEEIDSIFSQTKLLALNASIEAARAGELGKGFEVVAEEIRKLSDESSAASNNIKQITSELDTTVEKVSNMIKEGVKVSRKGYKEIDTFTEVLDEINYSSEMVEEVIVKEGNLIGSIGTEFHKIAGEMNRLTNLSKDNIDTVAGIQKSITEQTDAITKLGERMKAVGTLAKNIIIE